MSTFPSRSQLPWQLLTRADVCVDIWLFTWTDVYIDNVSITITKQVTVTYGQFFDKILRQMYILTVLCYIFLQCLDLLHIVHFMTSRYWQCLFIYIDSLGICISNVFINIYWQCLDLSPSQLPWQLEVHLGAERGRDSRRGSRRLVTQPGRSSSKQWQRKRQQQHSAS